MSLPDALWLVRAFPLWYFEPLADLATDLREIENPLFMIPVIGTLCLVAGAIWGIVRGRRSLWLFVMPLVLSELLVAIAGAFRGELKSGGEWVYYPFLAVQLALVLGLIFYSRGARIPALLVSVFTLTYAFFAVFVASMAFQDVWL